MTGVLIAALVWQFAQKRYVPAPYWLAVVLISVVGTLITDNLVDNLARAAAGHDDRLCGRARHRPSRSGTPAERTLSIHSIFTTRREIFYWLAILFTFALGTAAGDLVAEQFALGYLATGILFGMIIASLTIGYFSLGLNTILGLLAGLHPDAAAGRLVRRSAVAADPIWRPRPRHDHHQPHLPRRHRRDRHLHDDHAARWRRGVGRRPGAGHFLAAHPNPGCVDGGDSGCRDRHILKRPSSKDSRDA